MTLSSKRILIIFSVCLNIGFILVAVTLFVKHPPHDFLRHAPGRQILSEMNLSEDVRQAARDERDMFEKERQSMREERRAAWRRVFRLYAAEKTDGPEFRELEDELIDMARKRNDALFLHFDRIQDILGPEQSAVLFKKLESRVRHHRRDK